MILGFTLAVCLVPNYRFAEPIVTFECKAGRIENVFPELSKAAGVPLLFSSQTKDEVLILSVKDVPLDQLRKRIARAVSAEWVAEERGGYRLLRSPKLLKELEASHRGRVMDRLGKAREHLKKQLAFRGEYSERDAQAAANHILEYRRELNKEPLDPSVWARPETFQGLLPGWRLGARIALALDPQILAAIPPRESLVFSSYPNPSQRPFPKPALAAIQSYTAEADRLGRLLPSEVSEGRYALESNVDAALRLGQLEDRAPSKVLAIVDSPWETGSCQVRILIKLPDGTALSEGFVQLSSPNEALPPPMGAAIPGEAPLRLSPLAMEHFERLRESVTSGSLATTLSRELRDFVLHPEKNEPSALLCSEALLGIAKSRQLQLVARPSAVVSHFWSLGRFGDPKSPSISATHLWTRLQGLDLGLANNAWEERDGWLVGWVPGWIVDRGYWPEPAAVGKFLRGVATQAPGLDDMAALALNCPTPRAYSYARRHLPFLWTDTTGRREFQSYDLLRFYGSLSNGQREAAAESGLQLEQLAPSQLAQLRFMVFERANSLTIRPDEKSRKPDEPLDYEAFYGGLKSEPTERYPLGLPKGSRLRMLILRESRIRTTRSSEGSRGGYTDRTAHGLATLYFVQERPELRLAMGEETLPDRFSAVETLRIGFELRTLPGVLHYGQLSLTLTATEPVASYKELPAGIVRDIEASLEQQRKSLSGLKPPPPSS